jgi:alpha-L-rhamnosidase
MKKTICLLFPMICGVHALLAMDPTPVFQSAKPVWLAGRETECNLLVGFRATIDSPDLQKAVLRMTGITIGRIYVNGQFAGYGPARGPHGFDRVDEWPIGRFCKTGSNVIAVEVAGYNATSYYFIKQPSYFQAEVVAGDKVLASTAGEGVLFEAQQLKHRIQKVPRYSFQRPFSEAYRLTPEVDGWRTGVVFTPEKLASYPQRPLLARLAPYPAFKTLPAKQEVCNGTFTVDPKKKLWVDRAIQNVNEALTGFPQAELEMIPVFDVQRMVTATRTQAAVALDNKSVVSVQDKQYRIIDFGRNNSGFIGATVKCAGATRIYFVFDEVLKEGDVDIRRYDCSNVLTYDLAAAGTYNVESFEPYTLRFMKVIVMGEPCEVSNLYFREYVNPDADLATFKSSDDALNSIFEAARETFKQNAVDVFTDCPGRERAGWLCDSFFISRVAVDLCGNTEMERLFIQNFLLPKKFEALPEGMLPMCYPADHLDGVFIPNWAMWFVLQLDEYVQRSGDREMADALKPRVLALLDYFKKFRNSDGLLEKLEKWVFVEWSQANKLVQDVNYPSNMTYAEVLSCVSRLYNMPALEKEAEGIRETVRKQSYNGTFFVDNAVRQKDGTLKLSGERTETCQYYAFFFKTATPKTHPELWAKLRDGFGPHRKEKNNYPEIHFANAFIGNYLRLELLSREGLTAQILNETKGYFLKMAELTGTLWENDTTVASCCHGFASHCVRLLYRDVLGLRSVDRVNKKVEISFSDVPLQTCSGSTPVTGGMVSVSWRKADNTFFYKVDAPNDYKLLIDTSRLPCKAVRE